MKKASLHHLLLALVLLGTGCASTTKIETQAKAGADYSRYRTFAVLPLPETGPASDPGLMLRTAEPARQAIVAALTAKGFTEVESLQADLAINLRGQSQPKVIVTDWGYQPIPGYAPRSEYYAFGRYRDVQVRAYEERILSIEIFDHRTKELVWVGWSKSEERGATRVETMQAIIQKILAEFPPGSTPPKP